MKRADDFETFLSRQPFRAPPPEWKDEILRQAGTSHAAPVPLPIQDEAPPTAAPVARLWPSPYAWGGLAAIWLALLALKMDTPSAPMLADGAPPLSPPEFERLLAVREQEIATLLALAAPMPAPLLTRPAYPAVPPRASDPLL